MSVLLVLVVMLILSPTRSERRIENETIETAAIASETALPGATCAASGVSVPGLRRAHDYFRRSSFVLTNH